MAKTCSEIFANIPCTILGNPQEEVSGIAYRSDCVHPGDMFFCIVGLSVDGHTFAQDAIDRGAKVLVVERKLYLADVRDVTEVVVADSRAAMAHAACAFYDNPAEAFSLVGITGTNGKTTTTYLVEHIARALGLKTGVIGTVGVQIDGVRTKSEHTTPESPDLQKIFAQMRDEGCQVVSAEVSSHALDLKRTLGTKFSVTAFSNLTQDHLDYHHNFDDYFEAKAKLFSSLYPARRVICINDKWGRELAARCQAAGDDVVSVGAADTADIYPLDIEFSPHGTHARFSVCGRELVIDYPLVGKFNVENVMVALGCGIQLGFDGADVASALKSVHSVPGRLERVRVEGGRLERVRVEGGRVEGGRVEGGRVEGGRVEGGAAALSKAGSATENLPAVYVDYAHTPDALAKAMDAVREFTKGKLIVVFGCGGDRDAAKRPIMGKAALAADLAIVTSDNPRSEKPEAIIEDILAGMRDATPDAYKVEPNRAAAIKLAIDMAQAEDSILIAGKGHEDYQILATETIHFDDREVAARALREKAGE